MTRGLVRKNNLSDLDSPEQARINLGLATADYNRIRGLYSSAGVSNLDVQRIAGSIGNYQQQIISINATVSGIPGSLYVNQANATISGEWNNVGSIGAVSILVSGVTIPASSDALFVHEYQNGQFRLTTSTLTVNTGLTIERLVDNGNITFASGVVANTRIPVMINGVPFFIEAG
jgi:hypothetical protein